MGSSAAVAGPLAARFRASVILPNICSYRLIKNIPRMLRYRPACNGGR